jgi:hypothetical protein
VSSAKSACDSPAAYGRTHPIYLWNPSGFDPLVSLGEPLGKRTDLARFVVHKIIWSNVFGRTDKRGFVTLKAAYLRAFFPDSGVYSRVMKGLTDSGAIVCDGQYIEGEKCLGYKLNAEFSKMRQRRIQVTDPRLAKKIARSRVDFLKSLKGVHRHLHDHLEAVDIDQGAALESLLTEDFEPTNETAVQLIRDRQFFFHVCEYGRVHTNLTNLDVSDRTPPPGLSAQLLE